jgi:hypothetical protein
MLMNADAVVHALASVTVPAENLVLLLLWIVANVEIVHRLAPVAFRVPVVVDVVDRQKKRYGGNYILLRA